MMSSRNSSLTTFIPFHSSGERRERKGKAREERRERNGEAEDKRSEDSSFTTFESCGAITLSTKPLQRATHLCHFLVSLCLSKLFPMFRDLPGCAARRLSHLKQSTHSTKQHTTPHTTHLTTHLTTPHTTHLTAQLTTPHTTPHQHALTHL